MVLFLFVCLTLKVHPVCLGSGVGSQQEPRISPLPVLSQQTANIMGEKPQEQTPALPLHLNAVTPVSQSIDPPVPLTSKSMPEPAFVGTSKDGR